MGRNSPEKPNTELRFEMSKFAVWKRQGKVFLEEGTVYTQKEHVWKTLAWLDRGDVERLVRLEYHRCSWKEGRGEGRNSMTRTFG